jgi:hypothetical protein
MLARHKHVLSFLSIYIYTNNNNNNKVLAVFYVEFRFSQNKTALSAYSKFSGFQFKLNSSWFSGPSQTNTLKAIEK